MTELEIAPVAEDTRMAWWGSREGIVIGRALWPVRQPQARPGPRRPAPERPAQ